MQNVKLNLIPGSVMPVVNVSQYDKARQFSLTVYEGSAAYSLTGKDVQIRGTKPDGNGFAYDQTDGVVSVSGNTVTISTKEQMTAVGGQTMAELRITQSGVILGTLNFILMVEPSALSDDTPISETEIPAIERLAEEQVEQAEAWARGTKSGTPVSSDEPQYHNNSKYWSEVAAQYAAGGLHFMGSVAFASIPTTGMVNGDMYNITDDFTTDARFIEGAGVEVKAGADIAWLDSVSKWDILALGGGGDELADLDDVDITTPADGDLLQYNSTSQEWENSNAIPQELSAMQEAGAVNLLDVTIASQTINGVTFTVNADKTITVNGTASAETWVTVGNAGTMTKDIKASGLTSTGSFIAKIELWNGSTFVYGRDITTTSEATIAYRANITRTLYRIRINNGATVNNVVFKPMIYDSRLVNPPYQPYAMTNRELTDVVDRTPYRSMTVTSGTKYDDVIGLVNDALDRGVIPRIIAKRNDGFIVSLMLSTVVPSGTLRFGGINGRAGTASNYLEKCVIGSSLQLLQLQMTTSGFGTETDLFSTGTFTIKLYY